MCKGEFISRAAEMEFKMDVTEKGKVDLLVHIFLRAIMGDGKKTENAISEVLADNYIHDKMQTVISDFDEGFIKKVIAVLASNGAVCDTLNNIPGSAEEKQSVIINCLWTDLIKNK